MFSLQNCCFDASSQYSQHVKHVIQVLLEQLHLRAAEKFNLDILDKY